MTDVPVHIPGSPYTVHVAPGALDRVGQIVPPPVAGQGAALVADGITAELFARRAEVALNEAGWRVCLLVVPAGEGSKTLEVAGGLHERLTEAGIDRAATVFALGGGVVGDLAGFVAATYRRGISFVPLPTTLMAQVDSSVGGKVGVDLPQAKNVVGAFHQPSAVVADPESLQSLDPRQIRAGMAEVVKHAAIADAALFHELEQHADRLVNLDLAWITDVVARNCRIKAAVVAQDPEERTGVRAVLNYGHTIGHAIERAAADWQLLHGEAVAIGMVAEARAAARLGLSDSGVPQRVERLLQRLGLPTAAPSDQVDADLAEAALRSDKKVIRGRLASPVVAQIGKAGITEKLTIEELAASIRDAQG
jgi:3-dehydroquinate synthase